MEKNFCKIFSFLFLFLVIGVGNAFAKDLSELSSRTYVIGSYEFAPGEALTTDRIMLASKTIPGSTLDDMIIYYKNANNVWVDAAKAGKKIEEAKLPTKFVIEYKVEGSKIVVVEEVEEVEVYGCEVASVSTIAKTSITVKLNEKPTANPTINDFKIVVGEEKMEITKVEKIASDVTGKTYILSVDLNNKEGKLVVNDLDAVEFDFKAPEIIKVIPRSDKIFDITYSEDVNAGLAQLISNYSLVETGTANVVNLTSATAEVLDTMLVRITLGSGLTKDTNYTVTAKNMQDVSKNKNQMATAGSSVSFKAIVDEEKPTIVSAEAKDANLIEVQMSELMGTVPTATVQLIKTDGTLDSSITNTAAIKSDKNDIVTITIGSPSDYLENGKTYRVTLTGGADLSGNPIAAEQKIDVEGLRDEVAPVVSSTSFDKNKLTIVFSKKMNTTNLTTSSNYFVFNSLTGESVNNANYTVTKNKSNNEVYIVFNEGVLLAKAYYTVRIDSQTDAAIIPNSLAENTTISFTTPEAEPVKAKLTNVVAGGDGKTLTLTFSGTITKQEAGVIANYVIAEVDDTDKFLQVISAKYVNATTVELTTAAQEEISYKLKVNNFTYLSDVNDDTEKTFTGIDKVKATLKGVDVLGLSFVDLVFSEKMAVNQSEVTVSVVETGTANTIIPNSLGSTSGFDNKIRVEFSSPLTAGKSYTITITGAKDRATTPNESDAQTATFIATQDTVAPKIVNIESKNAATIEVTFDEEIIETGTLNTNNFIVKKGTNAITWGTLDATISATDKTKLILKNEDGSGNLVALFENDVEYTLTVKDNSGNYIADVSGNKVTESTYSFIGLKDVIKPRLINAAMNPTDDTKLVLTFSEAMQIGGANASDFIVTVANTGTAVTVNSISIGSGTDANKITLVLNEATIHGTQYRVYVINTSGNITDLAVTPNVVDSENAIQLFTGIDTTAPDVANATKKLTSASTMILTFNEKIAPESVSASDFDVNGCIVTKAEVQSNGVDVVLTFTGNDDTSLNPTVKLKDGAKIADLAGNEATGEITINGTYTDVAEPILVSTKVATANTIELTFSEKLTTVSEITASTEIAKVIKVEGYTISKIKVDNDTKVLIVTITEDLTGKTPTVETITGQTVIKDKVSTPNLYAGGDVVIAE